MTLVSSRNGLERGIVQQVADAIFSRGRWATTPREITETFASFGYPNPPFEQRSAIFHALIAKYETLSRVQQMKARLDRAEGK